MKRARRVLELGLFAGAFVIPALWPQWAIGGVASILAWYFLWRTPSRIGRVAAPPSVNRFSEPAHPYRLSTFDELPPVIVGPDGRCTCTAADRCPRGRTGTQERCTVAELDQLDAEARSRRAYQSGWDQ